MKTKGTFKSLIVLFTILFYSCGSKTPTKLLPGEWIWYPFRTNSFKVHFFKDGTISASVYNESRNISSDHQGTYKLINDESSLSLSFTFDKWYYNIEEDKPSVFRIVKLDSDSLILEQDDIIGNFSRVK